MTPDSVRHPRFSWRAAFLGGAVAIAGTAFFGTLVSNITLWVLSQRGLSLEEAYRQLFDSTAQDIIGAIVSALSNMTGGYTSSSLAITRFFAHAVAAGLVSLGFVGVMYLAPISYPGSAWTVAWTILIPVPTALIGGYLYVLRGAPHN